MRAVTIRASDESRRRHGVVYRIERLALRRRGRGPLQRAQLLLDVCYVAAILYVCARALDPDLPDWWFGAPGSHATIAIVLALPLLHFVLRRLGGLRPVTDPPLILLAAMAASALALGMSAYARCHGSHPPFFAPLTWTLLLFAGEAQETVFGQGACQNTPLAFELARLLAFSTTLGTALTAAMTLFRSERDRIAIWRTRSVTVVVGLDDDTVSMIRAIARTISKAPRWYPVVAPRKNLVVLTRNANSGAACSVHGVGAKIRVVNIDEREAMAELRLWHRLHRLYLLSEDPVLNLKRFTVIDAQVGNDRAERVRIPLTVRIDNPWQAEVLRRSFLAGTDRRWAGDAIGRYEVTAAKLVRHITTKRSAAEPGPPATVVLCGLYPLTYALVSALAQLQREQELYARADVVLPASVVILARGAQSFVDDHKMRQRALAPAGDALSLIGYDDEPTVDAIAEFVRQDPASYAVVFGDPSMETEGTRLEARYPELRVYVASTVATALVDFSLVGHLYSFPINMELDTDAPQDVGGQLIHEHYSMGKDRTRRATKPWKDLDPFFKGSNRRVVLNALWMVEKLADHTWNSFDSGPAAPLRLASNCDGPVAAA